MPPLALQAHLQAACEIVNDTNTFLYRDCVSHNRVLLEVRGVSQSCWNHSSSLVMVLRRPCAAQNFLSTTIMSLTISHAACRCACNAKGVIWSTFWREHKSRAIWPTKWKLHGMNMHKLKLMWTKYEVIRWKYVEVISISVAGSFFFSFFLGGGGHPIWSSQLPVLEHIVIPLASPRCVKTERIIWMACWLDPSLTTCYDVIPFIQGVLWSVCIRYKAQP